MKPEKKEQLSKQNLANHFTMCWAEYIHFKETKDKIVFFIGTLFVSVLFGTGLLIYKYSFDSAITSNQIKVLDKLYILQYALMHLFFLLLYLYYTYNNVQSKIFLIESQCCQTIIKSIEDHSSEEQENNLSDLPPFPISFIKKNYCNDKIGDASLKVRTVKDVANGIMVVIYSFFSIMPLFFNSDFGIFNAEIKFKSIWLFVGAFALIILFFILYCGAFFYKKARKEIIKKWQLENKADDFGA